ncbi:flagellar export protein FliJ [Lutispora thermophila]|uniref:Flagellar FliJ protein n=1 Tax=Lutispora thermophila DSM 19022 TaxID=1122184 RepID=A0A1M6G6N1_9FIRM|nr:flagellar export protein FliJ [Lutispora thermophila]SHJ05625.1 flagellar FliJ protein [Lutispora thermophila DSM 19022]
MATYKFKFQKVLEYRQSLEDQKKNLFSLSMKKYLREKDELNDLYNSLKNCNNELYKLASNGTTIGELRDIYEEQIFYREGIKHKTNAVIKAEEEVKKNRQELVKAMQNRKTMERLKEIYYNEFQVDEQRKNEKNIEEIVSFKESRM